MMPKESEEGNTSCTSTNCTKQTKKPESFESQRVYKKTSPNSVLTLYLGSRELISRGGNVEPLKGVIYVDPKFIAGHRLYGQLTLIFRYGREDEEVMGLKFCNEAVIALKQVWPKLEEEPDDEPLSPLQEALIERLGKGSYPFSIEVGSIAPPSVQLIPAKKYNGAPIGTSYDVRIYIADQSDEKVQRRSMVKLDIRLIHKISPYVIQPPVPSIPRSMKLKLSPRKLKLISRFDKKDFFSTANRSFNKSVDSSETKSNSIKTECTENHETDNGTDKTTTTTGHIIQGPQGSIDKPFLWADERVSLKASLNKSAYGHGENISVAIDIKNDSRKIVKKIKIFAVQHVDVCMFSNGKFKNVVANIEIDSQINSADTYKETFTLLPAKGIIKNWIAIEGCLFNTNCEIIGASANTRIASSAPRCPQNSEERNVFAIYVSYYVKIKLSLSGMGGEVSLKLPFVLGYVEDETNTLDKISLLNSRHLDGSDDNIVTISNIDCINKNSIEVIEEETEIIIKNPEKSKTNSLSDENNDIQNTEKKIIEAEVHDVEKIES